MRDSWKNRIAGIWVVAAYVLFGSLWILFSDTILGGITHDPALLQRISVFKGLAFILVSALLLYYLITLHIRRTSAVNDRLMESVADLRAAHEKLQLADFSIRSISDAVYWVDMDGHITDCNEAACTMLGYDRETLLAMSVEDMDPEYKKGDIQVNLEGMKRAGGMKRIRSHWTKDGRAVPVEVCTNHVVCNGKEYVCAVVRDIRERVDAEKEASFFKSLIEYTRDPFYVLSSNEDFRMIYANRAACDHFGVDLATLQTMRIPDWDPAIDMENIEDVMRQRKDGKSVRFETLHRVASGKIVPVEVTSSQLVHDGREYSCGYFYDITERKAMDDALKESEAKYRALSREFQALLNGIPDGLSLLSPDLKVIWTNPASAYPTNNVPEELIGRYCYEARHGRDVPCETCIALETFRTGEPQEKVLSESATNRTFELRSVPVRDETGTVVKVIEIGRDITEQLSNQAERIELERKLLHVQRLESLGVLAGGIAHDFNNILMGVMGNLSILRTFMPGNESLERIVCCEQAVTQATGLTCQLLTFAKGGDPVKKNAHLGPMIENAVSFALTGSSAAVQVAIADDLWPVEADEGQIGQVLNNLLINAAQAMPHGGVVHVDAVNRDLDPDASTTLEAGRYVAVTVRDQGKGISAENLTRIFDPYFTTKEHGTGLGLTSAFSIVRKHGGDIIVASEEGKGTRIEVFLPAGREPAAIQEAAVSQPFSKGKGRILVMDDEEFIRDMVGKMLDLLGYDAEGCDSGEALIQKYREKMQRGQTPDAVIIDLTVRGGMGGLDAAGAILAFDPAARLIVASGYSTDPVMANFQKYGFSASLAKPFRLEDLGSELAKILHSGEEMN